MTSSTSNEINNSEFVGVEYANVKTDVIRITEDKLRNILNAYLPKVKKSNDWLTPFSIMLTLLITFLTTNFSKDFLGISKGFWSMFFEVIFILSIVWLIVTTINCFLYRNLTKIDCLIDQIKNKN